MNSPQPSPPHWHQLLSPLLAGPEAQLYESKLREIFGPADSAELSLDDCLGEKKACLLCITPRSGSTYLRTLLLSTGQLGLAAEFMNLEDVPAAELGAVRARTSFDPIREVVKRYSLASLPQYLQHVVQQTASPSGVFSMKGDLYQYLPLLRRGLIRQGLRKLTYVYVTREDLLAQAISAFRAIRSGQWTSLHAARAKAEYDAAGILEQLDTVLRMMARWELVFAFLGVQPLRLTYEQIAARPTDIVRDLGSALGVAIGPGIQSPLRQQRDELSAQWAGQLRAAATDYIRSAGWTPSPSQAAPPAPALSEPSPAAPAPTPPGGAGGPAAAAPTSKWGSVFKRK